VIGNQLITPNLRNILESIKTKLMVL